MRSDPMFVQELLARYSFLNSMVSGCRVLELGAAYATGGRSARYLMELGAAAVTALESEERLLAPARVERSVVLCGVQLRAGPLQDLPDAGFDLVLAVHEDVSLNVLDEYRRVLVRYGSLVCPVSTRGAGEHPYSTPVVRRLKTMFQVVRLVTHGTSVTARLGCRGAPGRVTRLELGLAPKAPIEGWLAVCTPFPVVLAPEFIAPLPVAGRDPAARANTAIEGRIGPAPGEPRDSPAAELAKTPPEASTPDLDARAGSSGRPSPKAVGDSAQVLDDLFGTQEMREVFCDRRRLQTWLDVEAALARAEAQLGLIPTQAAADITASARVEQLDLGFLQSELQRTGHIIMAFVRSFQSACTGDAGQYIHWGATAQDIIDTGLILQLRDAHAIFLRDIASVERALVGLAETHATTLMAGRTHGQHALPITFGFKAAIWASEIHRARVRLERSGAELLRYGSLAGGAGTLASLGSDAVRVAELTLRELGLEVPDITWHNSRDQLADFILAVSTATATMAKICREIANLMKTEIRETDEPFQEGKVGSSTMPQKKNPMMCEQVIAMEKMVRAHAGLAIEAMIHDHERDMGAWMTEWRYVGESCVLAARAFATTDFVVSGLTVHRDRMRENLERGDPSICAEAVMMLLAERIGRQAAHDIVYNACLEAARSGRSLGAVLEGRNDVTRHVTQEELQRALDYSRYVSSAELWVNRVLDRARRDWNP